jgi:hypothetical protein
VKRVNCEKWINIKKTKMWKFRDGFEELDRCMENEFSG